MRWFFFLSIDVLFHLFSTLKFRINQLIKSTILVLEYFDMNETGFVVRYNYNTLIHNKSCKSYQIWLIHVILLILYSKIYMSWSGETKIYILILFDFNSNCFYLLITRLGHRTSQRLLLIVFAQLFKSSLSHTLTLWYIQEKSTKHIPYKYVIGLNINIVASPDT